MSIQAKYQQFHLDNPHVLDTLDTLASTWLRRHPRVGVGMLWEVLRWDLGFRTDGQPYKLDNNLRSRYARDLLVRHPEWDGKLRTRQLASA